MFKLVFILFVKLSRSSMSGSDTPKTNTPTLKRLRLSFCSDSLWSVKPVSVFNPCLCPPTAPRKLLCQ